MVLLHGFTGTWRAWVPVLPTLEAHHFVLAPTVPGHHGGPPLAKRGSVLREMVEFVERRMDAEGIDRAHLVGNSMGGWLSLELASRGRALSVVALCPGGGWERSSPEAGAIVRFFRRNELLLALARPRLAEIARRPRLRAVAFRDLVAHPTRMSASLAFATLESASRCSIGGGEVRRVVDEAASRRLSHIACPVRIVRTTGDRILDRTGHYTRLRRLLPEAEWLALEGLGHVPMSDDPRRVSGTVLAVSAPRASRK